MNRRSLLVTVAVVVAVATTGVVASRWLSGPNNSSECVVQNLKSSPGASVTIRITSGVPDGQLFVDLNRPDQPVVELVTMGLDFDLAQVVATHITAPTDSTEILEMIIRGEGSPVSEDVVRWGFNVEGSFSSTSCTVGGFVVDYIVSDEALDLEFGKHQVKVSANQDGGVFTYVAFP